MKETRIPFDVTAPSDPFCSASNPRNRREPEQQFRDGRIDLRIMEKLEAMASEQDHAHLEWIGGLHSMKNTFSLLSPKVMELHDSCKKVLDRINYGVWESSEEKMEYLRSVFGAIGEDCVLYEPLSFVVGRNLFLGNQVFVNMNVTFLDAEPIRIGDHTMIAPGCVITSAGHAISPKERRNLSTNAAPVTIGQDCWIGANTTILPGVTIGDNVIVGANSVVNKDIPSNCVAAGAPVRFIRKIRNDIE